MKEVESSKSLQVWQKIVEMPNKADPSKTMKQCKEKLAKLTQAYKVATGKNLQTGHGGKTSSFFDLFKEILG